MKVPDLKLLAKNLGIKPKGTKKEDLITSITSLATPAAIEAALQKMASAQPAVPTGAPEKPRSLPIAVGGLDTLTGKINEILTFLGVQNTRIGAIEARLKMLEQRDPKIGGGRSYSAGVILPIVQRAYSETDRKVADKVPVTDIIAAVKRQTGLPEDEIYNKLEELFYADKIELQLGKPAFGEPVNAFTRKFYWFCLKHA